MTLSAVNASRTETMNIINAAQNSSAELSKENLRMVADLESLEKRIKKLENDLGISHIK